MFAKKEKRKVRYTEIRVSNTGYQGAGDMGEEMSHCSKGRKKQICEMKKTRNMLNKRIIVDNIALY